MVSQGFRIRSSRSILCVIFLMAISFFPGGIAKTFSQGTDPLSDAAQCVAESNKGNPDLAIGHCDRALRVRDQLTSDLLVATLNGRAWAYMQKDDYYR